MPLQREIAATPEQVWKALVNGTTFWWPKSFYTGPKTRGFHIEARLDGKVYEDYGDGAGVIWFRIFAPLRSGAIFPAPGVARQGLRNGSEIIGRDHWVDQGMRQGGWLAAGI